MDIEDRSNEEREEPVASDEEKSAENTEEKAQDVEDDPEEQQFEDDFYAEKGERNKKQWSMLRLIGVFLLTVLLIATIAVVIVKHANKNESGDSIPSFVYSINGDAVSDIAPFASGVAVLTSNTVEYVDQYGNLMTKNEHLYSDPVMITAGKNLILFDRGGNNLRIEKNSVKYLQLDFESAVSCADITDKGTYAYVLNADSGYQSHLFVYSYKGNLLFEWSSAEYVLDVSVSPSGKYAAVCTMSVENAASVSRVYFFQFSKNEPVYVLDFADETVYDVEFVSGRKLAIQSNKASSLINANGEGEPLCTYSANELNHSDAYKAGMGVTAVNLYGNNNNALVYVFDKGRKKTFEHSYKDAVLGVNAAEGYVAVVQDERIEIISNSDTVIGSILLNEACIDSVISGNRIYVLSAGGILSYSVHENAAESGGETE